MRQPNSVIVEVLICPSSRLYWFGAISIKIFNRLINFNFAYVRVNLDGYVIKGKVVPNEEEIFKKTCLSCSIRFTQTMELDSQRLLVFQLTKLNCDIKSI